MNRPCPRALSGRPASGRAPGAWLLCLAMLLAGCLPKGSLSRRDEVEASLYALVLDVDVATDGAPIEPFRWHADGTVAWSYARPFRDGSMGHMVRFLDVRGRVERGDTRADVPVAFDGAVLELRSFPDGEILLVSGLTPYAGGRGHLELLDALWPGLSPHLPASRREAASFTTSWPAWVAGGPRVRNRLVASWTASGKRWEYEGRLSSEGGYVTGQGAARGEVVLGDGELRLREHRFAWERATTTRWPSGAQLTQTMRVSGSLVHAGAAPTPALDLPLAADDPRVDALPLRLADGRAVADPPADLAATAPFLFVPDDLGPVERAAIATIVGPRP